MQRLIPKFSIIAILSFTVGIPLVGKSQEIFLGERRITCTASNIRIRDFFDIVWQQTKVQAFYNDAQLDSYEVVSIDFRNVPLDNALAELLGKRGLIWHYRQETLVISRKENIAPTLTKIVQSNAKVVKGVVVDEKERPLQGVSVFTGSIGSSTNANGEFVLSNVSRGAILQVRKIGYKPMFLSSFADSIKIQLITLVAPLQPIDVSGNEQGRLTASTSSVDQKDIEIQPANNVLSILQGRVPGLYINQTTGLPGGGYKIRLRGRNSIESIIDPLILVDGVPFPSVSLNDRFVNLVGMGINPGANIGASPLNLLSINDIATVEILKGADATALYGGRGANGIIVINSKKPKRGEKSITANFYTGFGRAVNLINFLDNKQYTMVRLEAIKNDGRTPNKVDDYDIMVWDTTKYTDWQKEMIGGVAKIMDGSLQIKGGWKNLYYRISGMYRKESTVYPSDNFNYRKGSGRLQINYDSKNEKLKVAASGNYVADKNLLPAIDLTSYSICPPTTPSPYTGDKKLNFKSNFLDNPYVYMLRTSKAISSNFQNIVNATYEPVKSWQLKVDFGFNNMNSHEIQVNPISSFNPADNIDIGNSYFFNNQFRTTMLNISNTFKKSIGSTKISFIVGRRLFKDYQFQEGIQAYFKSDALLYNRSAAFDSLPLFKKDTNFCYKSLYSRIEIKQNDKYILTLTGSRDKSDKLSDKGSAAIFGAVSAAWIFSREKWFKSTGVFNYGRLRASWGYTGNDQYQNKSDEIRYIPGNLIARNRNNLIKYPYHWEKIRKAEIGVELGFFNDNVKGTICYYNNKSSDQLLTARDLTGPDVVTAPVNYPAVILNTGIELDITMTWCHSNYISVNSSVNLSFPRNKLQYFQNIDTLGYRYFYHIGSSLDMVTTYGLTGVDPLTGLYQFNNGRSDPPAISDKSYPKSFDPAFYGGFQNNLSYKGLELDVLFRFSRQNNYNYNFGIAAQSPGSMYNQPATVLNRWMQAGDNVSVQKFTTTVVSPAGRLYNIALSSDKRISEVTYLRLQSLMFGYHLSDGLLKKLKLKSCKLYLQGLNLFTITNYNGRDPEITTDAEVYPSLRIMTAGMQVCL